MLKKKIIREVIGPRRFDLTLRFPKGSTVMPGIEHYEGSVEGVLEKFKVPDNIIPYERIMLVIEREKNILYRVTLPIKMWREVVVNVQRMLADMEDQGVPEGPVFPRKKKKLGKSEKKQEKPETLRRKEKPEGLKRKEKSILRRRKK